MVKKKKMKLLEFLEKHGDILFRGYWCGGADDSPKKRKGRSDPKPLDYALKKFPWLLGALHPHIVLVDYDTKESFDCRVKIAQELGEHCVAIESTRGGHMFLYDTGHTVRTANTHNRTLLSFSPVDYKLGYKTVRSTGEIKTADSYACLSKEDKSLRELVYCNIREDSSLDEIPFYDLRVNASDRYDFLGMKAGDGRQDGLFTYMNPVKAAGYSYEQFKEAAEIIERYVLAVPLGDEFENAIRREAWDSVKMDSSVYFNEKGQFSFNRFGDQLIGRYHVKKINSQLYIYENGVYVPGHRAIEKAMLGEIPSLARARRNEVLDYLEVVCKDSIPGDLNRIAFKNGVYNINTDILEPFNPEYVITNMIPWSYNPSAKCNLVDEILDKLSDGDINTRYLLEELIGACMYRSNTIGGGKAFILKGDKNNGKSTYLEMLSNLLGSENISNLDFKDLDSRFKTSQLVGKLANIGDDISDSYKEDVSVFKKLVTGEKINVERKGQEPFDFRSHAKLIFSANNMPRIKDSTGAAQRRLMIIPFNRTFSENDRDYDPHIRYKLAVQEAMEYLIQLALDGLGEVLTNNRFTIPKKVQQEKEDYARRNNPVLAFIEECKNDSGEVENIYNEPTADVYKRYDVFCHLNGFKVMSNIEFSKQINRELKTKSSQKKINGKNIKVFEKVSDW